jgi:hypothetical protein
MKKDNLVNNIHNRDRHFLVDMLDLNSNPTNDIRLISGQFTVPDDLPIDRLYTIYVEQHTYNNELSFDKEFQVGERNDTPWP